MRGSLLILCFSGIRQTLGYKSPPLTHEEGFFPNDHLDMQSLNRKFELLINRVEELEARDKANQHELQDLKKQMKSMEEKDTENQQEIRTLHNKVASLETVITLNEDKLQTKRSQLKSECEQDTEKLELDNQIIHNSEDRAYFTNERKEAANEDANGSLNASVPITEYRKRRAQSEVEVAFYAHVTGHDVLQLGANQNIVFDNTVTNLGNAYHRTHGLFTAPVAGTYIFFFTVSAETATNSDHHYYAYLDVNGFSLSWLILTPNEQSSQTAILQLNAGDDVSIKNSHPGDNVLGGQWSTFAGFLLFQDYSGSSQIVG